MHLCFEAIFDMLLQIRSVTNMTLQALQTLLKLIFLVLNILFETSTFLLSASSGPAATSLSVNGSESMDHDLTLDGLGSDSRTISIGPGEGGSTFRADL